MKNWLILTKVHLAGITGFNKLRYSDNKSEKRKTGLVLGLYALFGVLMIAFVSIYAVMFAELGLTDYIISLSFAISSLMTLTFTLLRGAHILFAVKDYDMLVSLPVKKSDILISRLLTSYIVNFAFGAVVMIPCTVVAFAFGAFRFDRLIYTLIALIVSPVIPLVISNILSTLIMAATGRMRHKAILQAIFSAIAVIAVMALSFLLSYAGNGGVVNVGAETLKKMLLVYPPAWLLQQSMSGNGFYWVIILVAASLAFAAAFVAVLAKFYLKINAKLISRNSSGKFELKNIKAGSSFSAMYKNEFARLISTPTYLINSTAGLLLLVIASVASLFFNPFNAFDPATVEELKFSVCPLMAFMIGMTIPTSYALSLEGNRRWVIFSLPVSAFKILMAKVLMSLTLSGTAGLICAAVMTFSLGLSAAQSVLLFATVIAFALFSALFGMLMNVKFPKYDWTSEAAVVKRSAATNISVIVGIIPPLLIFMLGSMITVPIAYLMAGLDVIYILISGICLFCLKNTKLCDK